MAKSAASAKRAKLPLNADYLNQFAKDWARLNASGRYDMHRLKGAVALLILNDGPMPPEYVDQELKGNWKGCRECHVGGDFLLIYKIVGDMVVFTRTGPHTDLFEE